MTTRLSIQTCMLLICILALSTSCKKEKVELELVPITTTGENTMGFYVDGVPVNIKGDYGGLCVCGVNGWLNMEGVASIFGSSDNPNFSITIYFPIDSLDSSKVVVINESTYKYEEIRCIDDSPLGGRSFKCDSLHRGKIKILRLDDHVIAGTFEFDAIHPESGKVIHVTEGRFDINLK